MPRYCTQHSPDQYEHQERASLYKGGLLNSRSVCIPPPYGQIQSLEIDFTFPFPLSAHPAYLREYEDDDAGTVDHSYLWLLP